MAKFVVSVEEILRRNFIVEAENISKAKERLEDAYMDLNVVLDAEDWCFAEFESEGEADEDDLARYKNLDDIL